jgi:hypothetical protein
MVKWLLIALVPVALAGCVPDQGPALPLALGPADTAQASCLRYAGAPAYGDCKALKVEGAALAQPDTE